MTSASRSIDQIAVLPTLRTRYSYRQLDLEDWSWRYIAAGRGVRSLLLLPGAFIGAEMWMHLIPALQDGYRVIAPDLPSKALTAAELNAAIIRLLKAEGIHKIVVLGYSAGGGLAQAFAQARPDRVEHLILSHCTALSADAAHRLDRMAGVLKLLPHALIRSLFHRRNSRYPSDSEWAECTRAFFAERIATLQKSDFITFLQAGANLARTFHFDPGALQGWQGKTLLLSSKDDATTFPRWEKLQARYPENTQTHLFERGGHHTILLFPDTYNQTIIRFLESIR